jgi:hypothetical protein
MNRGGLDEAFVDEGIVASHSDAFCRRRNTDSDTVSDRERLTQTFSRSINPDDNQKVTPGQNGAAIISSSSEEKG